jgi:hypothetical protein
VKDIKDKQAVLRPAKLENGRKYALQVKVQEGRGAVAVLAMLDGQPFVNWKGSANRLTAPSPVNLPSPRSVAFRAYESSTTTHSFQLVVSKGGMGYQLQNDWKNPLDVVAAAPPQDIAKECTIGNGRSYYIWPKPITYSDAQRLAARLRGRILTISSLAENDFIFQYAKGRSLWMAGWRPIGSDVWRDERNRPLRMFNWERGEPNNRFGRQLRSKMLGTTSLWDDDNAWEQAYACIEWGEERNGGAQFVAVDVDRNDIGSVPHEFLRGTPVPQRACLVGDKDSRVSSKGKRDQDPNGLVPFGE